MPISSRSQVLVPYPASISTTPRGKPAAQAARTCSSAISGLVRNPTVSGMPEAALAIGDPFQRQIQAPGDRQAHRMIGQRQADRNLTVVLLAELAAILMRHPDRMAAFLRKAGVVDDPGFDRAAAFDERQSQLLDAAENPLIRPRRVGDEMQ